MHVISKWLFAILAVVILYFLFPIITPFLTALVFAVLLEPVVGAWMKGKLNRSTSVTITYVLFVSSLAAMLFFASRTAFKQIREIIEGLPNYLPYFVEWFKQFQKYIGYINDGAMNALIEQLKNVTTSPNGVVSTIGESSIDIAKWIPGFVIVFIVFLIALFLFSLHLPRMKEVFLDLFVEETKGKVEHILSDLNKAIIGFLRAQIIISSLIFFLATLGLLILNTPYPFAIGLFITVVDILPILGTGSVLIPWAIYAFFHDDTFLAIGLIVLFTVITVIRRISEPKILGDSLGLSTISTLISIYIGFALLGMKGLIIGPIVVIIFNAMRKVGLFQYKIRF